MTGSVIEEDLITRKRVPIKTVSSEIWYNYVCDINYKPILDSFNNGIMTIDEIRLYYSQINQEKKRSKSTIYRYLKELINFGLVIEVGRRFYQNQVSSKTLYDKGASIFIPVRYGLDIWFSEQGVEVANTLGFIVRKHFGNKKPDSDAIRTLFAKFETSLQNNQIELVEKLLLNENDHKGAREIIKEIRSLGKSSEEVLNEAAKIIWIIRDQGFTSFLSDLRECFQEGKNNNLSDSEGISDKNKHQNDSNYQDIITYYPKFYQFI
ncbi:MAG: hypothetical protein ACFFBD_24235, partial [Candidatus Hodarchaeota archaeon]